MFTVRENEPEYARLRKEPSKKINQYGNSIDTVPADDALCGFSLNINSDAEVGENPDRYKQHGFYFNADNCIGCHACEAACSEKNEVPSHLAFRSVGFVEGGTYPNYQRLNISMACNHCDDPVCLKGCPTRAYTKFAEYGAVLQDPDICFGCGYCTWVCPYNAPQLDPVEGTVSKCNMCVDRLEVGLKPACVSACLGNALDFGVIENTPENRTQVKTEIPGFPRTDITNPNIRFQQTRSTQRDMVRVDNTAVKYHKDDNTGKFKPELDPKHDFKREWNLKKLLGSHESAHVAFTLSIQTVMGAFVMLTLGAWTAFPAITTLKESSAFIPLLIILLLLTATGLFKLNMHLGKPHRFYRGFYNLKMSPVSREIAGISAFFTGLIGVSFFALFDHIVADTLQVVFALLALAGIGLGGYFMYKLYRIKARPYWDHWHTGASFIGTGLSLGALLIAIVALVYSAMTPALATILASFIALGLILEGIGLLAHSRDLSPAESEGAASFYEQSTTYGYPYWLRNGLLIISLMIALTIALFSMTSPLGFLLLGGLTVSAALIGRSLFYVLVIPTTMPGAFFWRNKGFVEHARETGLADMPQMGVAYEKHHKFDVQELLQTIKETTPKEAIAQFKRVFTG
ncbi:MAG TPA: 4Fe-4S dicluster domain-containing protein [Leucothrix mucor]|uniref:4Fe-4S dicluster domain-containing protein n=1 Tax=Leucothrix mucor TaxID=45248 RepID=A0A7V2T2M2_LEUMU|nr:4Fe-4S dicluster domain-containing protein [Leucothrix mucor]